MIASPLDRYNHLEEFNDPLDTGVGVLTPTQRRAKALAVLSGATMSAAQLAFLAGVTAGTAAASKALVLNSSGAITTGLKQLVFDAGTATVAPIKLTSGTNLTTAAAGAFEFDGDAFYATAVASARQQVVAEQIVLASADSATYNNTGLDTNTAAAVFTATMGATANGAVTLVAGKTYSFEAMYSLTNTGTTSHTWATLFGGTATITASNTQVQSQSAGVAANAPTASLMGFGTGTDLTVGGAGIVITAASTSATEQVTVLVRGTLVVNAGGTLIPQMKASARPGASGTPGVIVKRGSYFKIQEMSSSATVGNWS